MDRKALWFAVGIGCVTGLVLLAMVATSNYIQGAPQETIIWLLAPCTPLAGLGGYGLGRGRND